MQHHKFSATLQMMCQQLTIFKDRGVSAGEVAQWLKVSKPTALELLTKLIADKLIYRVTEEYRPNAKIFYHYPTKHTWELFEDGAFVTGYQTHLQSIAKPYQGMSKEWSKGDVE